MASEELEEARRRLGDAQRELERLEHLALDAADPEEFRHTDPFREASEGVAEASRTVTELEDREQESVKDIDLSRGLKGVW